MSKRNYLHDCQDRKEDPATVIKWMRRNFGERGNGWDFSYSSGSNKLWIELSNARYITMYEMWYN